MRRCMWCRNLKNEEAMARVGPQRHRKKEIAEVIHENVRIMGVSAEFRIWLLPSLRPES